MNDTLKLRCLGLDPNGRFLPEHTGRGADRSPAFILENLLPEGKALAMILEDLSHPIPGFPHWTVWNLPAETEIPAGIPAGARGPGGIRQGIAYGWWRYAGPKPPRGRRHLYRFTVFVLDAPLILGPWSGRRRLLQAAAAHTLQRGSVTGYFE